MKKYYTLKNVFHFLLIISALLTGLSNASAALSQGDIAVIGMNSDPDGPSSTKRSFAIVTLASIAADEEIYFTDRGWVNAFKIKKTRAHFVGSLLSEIPLATYNNEGTFQWKPSEIIPAGTVIIFKFDLATKSVSGVTGDGTALPSSDLSILAGTWINANLSANPWPATGDQILIYQGSESNPSFIFAFNNIRSTATNVSNGWYINPNEVDPITTIPLYGELPEGLAANCSLGFLTHPTNDTRYPNAIYNPTMSIGTKTTWLNDIANTDKWSANVTGSNAAYDFGGGFGSDSIKQFTMARPSVLISSSAGESGGTTLNTPIPVTVTFSEAVTGFDAGDITAGNATISGFSGSGTTYTFELIPNGFGAVTLDIAENKAVGPASNGNTAAQQFVITYQQNLPVTLISYSVKSEGGSAKLEWSTATEDDNSHYEIEHSTNAKEFKMIGFVESKGSSPGRRNYTWYDRNPSSGANYYRLIQVDYDGTSTKYGIKALDFGPGAELKLLLYPNPTLETVTIPLAEKTKSLELSDINGRLLRRIPTAHEKKITIQVDDLIPGTYFIRLITDRDTRSGKFTKF